MQTLRRWKLTLSALNALAAAALVALLLAGARRGPASPADPAAGPALGQVGSAYRAERDARAASPARQGFAGYALRPAEGGAFRAGNPNLRLALSFDARGAEFVRTGGSISGQGVRLELAGAGATERAELAADGERLEARRGDVTERYENLPHAVRHTVTIGARPIGEDSPDRLTVRLAASGYVAPERPRRAGGGPGLALGGAAGGEPLLFYRQVEALDANGTLLDCELLVGPGGQALISADASEAAFPVTLVQEIAPAAVEPKTWEDEVVELTNEERQDHGALPPLKRASALDTAAARHCYDMATADFFSHTSRNDPDWLGILWYYSGELPEDRIDDCGYVWTACAENIAGGYTSPASVVAGWMDSSEHRDNILSTDLREIGVGLDYYYYSYYGYYWAQNFGRRDGVFPVVIEREAYRTPVEDVTLHVYAPVGTTLMRFQNESEGWSGWEAYSASKLWTLSAGEGLKTVYCEITDGITTWSSYDSIVLQDEPDDDDDSHWDVSVWGSCALGGAPGGAGAVGYLLPWLAVLAAWAAGRRRKV